MRFLLTLFCLSISVYLSCANPYEDPTIQSNPLIQWRDLNVFENTRNLIKGFAEKLHESAQQAIKIVDNISKGIQEEIILYTEKINTDIQNLEGRIDDAIKTVGDRFTDVGEGIRTCIESHRQQADTLMNQTNAKAKACAEDRIKELRDKIDKLNAQSANALDYAKNILESMTNCSVKDNGEFLNVGLCLAPIALQAETMGAIFMADSGISIARINFAMGTLPAAFEICTGSNVMEASIATARIIIEIGSCSASSIFHNLVESA